MRQEGKEQNNADSHQQAIRMGIDIQITRCNISRPQEGKVKLFVAAPFDVDVLQSVAGTAGSGGASTSVRLKEASSSKPRLKSNTAYKIPSIKYLESITIAGRSFVPSGPFYVQ